MPFSSAVGRFGRHFSGRLERNFEHRRDQSDRMFPKAKLRVNIPRRRQLAA
jgi:hypothetical protein